MSGVCARSPGRLGERQRAAQQLVGFFAHDEAGAAPRVSGSFAGWLRVAKRSIRRVCDRSGSCHAGGRGGGATSGVCARVTGRRQRLATMHAVTTRITGRPQRLATVRVAAARGIADSCV